jgi:hypothetical protein
VSDKDAPKALAAASNAMSVVKTVRFIFAFSILYWN